MQRLPSSAVSGPTNHRGSHLEHLEQPSSSSCAPAVQQAQASAQLAAGSSTMQLAEALPPAQAVQLCEAAVASSSAMQPSCSKKRVKEDSEDAELQQAASKRARSREPDNPIAVVTGQTSLAASTAAYSSREDSGAAAVTEDAAMPDGGSGDDARIVHVASCRRSVRLAKRRANGLTGC